jgi:arylsulfatase A-like enzyme
MSRISIGDAAGRGLRIGFLFGLLLGLQEGLAAVTITQSRTSDVTITDLAKLARVFFTPLLVDGLGLALLALFPALALWAWHRTGRGAGLSPADGFDPPLAGLLGCGTVLIYGAFSTYASFHLTLLLETERLLAMLRIGFAALLAGLALQVLVRRCAGSSTPPAVVLALIGILVPSVPLILWVLRNSDHPAGGRLNLLLLLAGCLAAFLALAFLLRRAMGNDRSRRWAVRAWFLLVLFVLLTGTLLPLAFAPGPQTAAGTVRVPGNRNVLLFTVDTLRSDAMDFDDPQTSNTPNAARLAAAGTRFDNTQSQSPWTLPSFCSLMTAIHPGGQGVVSSRNRLDTARRTLAEELASAGYLTQAVVCNAWLTETYGLDQGFDNYNHVWEEAASEFWMKMIWVRVVRRFRPDYLKAPDSHDSAQLVDRAIRFLEENAESNFFLWVHVIDPHDPYAPLGRFRALAGKGYRGRLPAKRSGIVNMLRRGQVLEAEDRRHLRQLYDLEVRYTDEQFGRLLDTLDSLGLFDNTLVVFTSDHGEEFWEHENVGHGHTLYNELTRVPLVIKPPGNAPPVQRVDAQVRLIDLAPTILDILRLPPMTEGQGTSLLPLMEGAPAEDRQSFGESLIYFGEKKSVDDGRYRLILSPNSGGEELYDLLADPGARHNLAPDLPQVLQRLRASLDQHLIEQQRFYQGLEKSAEGDRAVLDSRTRERLRSLGYIQ